MMMISFCRSFHTFLGFPDSGSGSEYKRPKIPDPEIAGLRHLIADPPPPPPPPPPPDRGDPGAWGLHESAIGLCTESLGSESCDTGVVVDEEIAARTPRRIRRSMLTEDEAAEAAAARRLRFPPPLPWLSESRNRRSCCFMKGEKKDGRFVLREVWIERPEVLRASRQNGRLRLDLVEEIDRTGDECSEEEEEEEEGEEERAAEAIGVMRCQDHDGIWWRKSNTHQFVTTA